MKKILINLLLICSLAVSAQLREKGDNEIIATIGFSQSGSDFLSNARSSIRIGVLGDHFFNDRWSLRTGLASLNMGDEGFLFFQRNFETNYIHVPINANWHFGSTRKWNLNFGLSVGILTSAKENGIDVSDTVETFQFGLSYGIGYKLQFSEKFSILFDYQAFEGFTDYIKDNSSEARNLFASFNIGAVFKL